MCFTLIYADLLSIVKYNMHSTFKELPQCSIYKMYGNNYLKYFIHFYVLCS